MPCANIAFDTSAAGWHGEWPGSSQQTGRIHAHPHHLRLAGRTRRRTSHAVAQRRAGLRRQHRAVRRRALRRHGRPRDRCARQARGAGLHRHPCAFRPSRLAPADLRHRARRLFRPAVPGDQRRRAKARGSAAIRATCVPTTIRRPTSCGSTRSSRSPSCCATASRPSSSSAASCACSRRCSRVVGELGIRAYLGPGFDSGRWVGGAGGKLVRVVDEAAGEREFELALEFIERHQGAHGDRVRGILVPREIETCTVPLMRKAARAARERDLPVGDPRRLQHPRGVRHHPRAPDDVGGAAARGRADVGHGSTSGTATSPATIR